MIPDVIKLFEVKLEERRGEERFEATLSGRYRLDDGPDYPCWTIDISLTGVAIKGFGKGRVGDRVVADIDRLGRVEGIIARHLDDGVAVEIQGSAINREELARQIARLVREKAFA